MLDERARPIVLGRTNSATLLGVPTNGRTEVFLAHLDLLADVAERYGAPATPERAREAAVAALWDVVYADGNRHAKEDLLVGEIAGLLGVDEATCERIRDEEVANWDKNH